jgi:hypothetical protein
MPAPAPIPVPAPAPIQSPTPLAPIIITDGDMKQALDYIPPATNQADGQIINNTTNDSTINTYSTNRIDINIMCAGGIASKILMSKVLMSMKDELVDIVQGPDTVATKGSQYFTDKINSMADRLYSDPRISGREEGAKEMSETGDIKDFDMCDIAKASFVRQLWEAVNKRSVGTLETPDDDVSAEKLVEALRQLETTPENDLKLIAITKAIEGYREPNDSRSLYNIIKGFIES